MRTVLHQVEGKAGMVLEANLIEDQNLQDLAQAPNCNRSSLLFYLNEELGLLLQWAHRDGLMPFHTS